MPHRPDCRRPACSPMASGVGVAHPVGLIITETQGESVHMKERWTWWKEDRVGEQGSMT